ncbi:MAG TPA: helix-turn-helix transcriptional regulator [Ktedonobacteraceae bacterium]|nr:helix-turn-helix transcriptional regulator [Ktedonobacteraceae bacterium]
MAIRLKVKDIAAARGLSKRRLVYRSEVDVKTLTRIYNNPESIVTTETLYKLAVALNVDASLLIECDPPLPKTLE